MTLGCLEDINVTKGLDTIGAYLKHLEEEHKTIH